MRGTVHGVLSLAIVTTALATGVTAMALASVTAAALYLVAATVAVPVILYAYCAKCPVRLTGCRHGLPGPLTRWLPARQAGPYTAADFIGLVLPLALLFAAPQPYLWHRPLLMACFWGLTAAGLVEIRRYVCTGCRNLFCPLRKP